MGQFGAHGWDFLPSAGAVVRRHAPPRAFERLYWEDQALGVLRIVSSAFCTRAALAVGLGQVIDSRIAGYTPDQKERL